MRNEPLFYLSLIIQIFMLVHVFRTRRPIYWAFIIFFTPLLGSLIYFIVELLPEIMGNPKTKKTFRGIRKSVNPGANIQKLEKTHKLSGSVDAARHLAKTLIENNRAEEAIKHYKSTLKGIYADDPDLLLGLAEAEFANQEYEKTIKTLDKLRVKNPSYRSASGHLMYARSLVYCNATETAKEEYESVITYFSGAEARCRYAELLETTGACDEALELYTEIVNEADLAPQHYNKTQKMWVVKSKEAIKRLSN